MILRLLAWLADVIKTRPGRVIFVVVLPALAASLLGIGVPTDLSFAGIMDRTNPLVAEYFAHSEQLKLGGQLPLLLEGKDDLLPSGENRLDAAAKAVAARLRLRDDIRQVDAEIPEAWMKANAPYLIDRQGFDAWLGLATHPEDGESPKLLRNKLEQAQAEADRLRPEGKRVVMVTLSSDPIMLDAGGGDYFSVEADTLAALEPFDVVGTYAGVAAVSAQDQRHTLSAVKLLTPVSLLLVLLLFALVEPRPIRLLVIAIPMMLTVGATLGLVGTILGGITVLESFFGILVFGLGVDFALHLMVRMREERAAGAEFDDAMRMTLLGAGRGIVAGGMTTSAAFAVIGLAPDPMAHHLGVSGALGLFLCLVFMLTLLPAAWTLLHRRASQESPKSRAGFFASKLMATQGSNQPVRIPFVSSVAHHAAAHPRLHLGAAFLFLVVAIAGIPRFEFETDLTRVFNRDVPAVGAIERLQKVFAINAAPWTAWTYDLDEARRITDELEKLDVIATVESVARMLPADGQDRRQLVLDAAKEIEAARVTYEALLPITGEKEVEQLRGLIELLKILHDIGQRPAPTPNDLPPSLKTRLLGPQGEFIIYAYVAQPAFDGYQARLEREAVQSVAPNANGFGTMVEVTMAGDRPWALPILLAVLALVCIVLAFDLRNFRMVLLALTPVVLGTVGTFGVLCWIGKPFSILSTLVVPLILGLGVDDGIHVVHRLKEDRTIPPAKAATQVGTAVVMTTATTCTSFAALMFTNHPGMEGMALIMLIGLPICLVGSITTLPALAMVLNVNRPQ